MTPWPELHYADWAETCETLHMWTQIVGKVRLAKAPLINHWWQVPLYVTSRGLGTSAIPDGARYFQIDFDFVDHRLSVTASDGSDHAFKLEPVTVAIFYGRVMHALDDLGIHARITTTPQEVQDPIPFEMDDRHRSYDPEAANRFWRALVLIDRVLTEFRSRFIGKVSPVHFFWGGFDMAVTRFSGREAPEHPSIPGISDRVTREGYSHECSSAGFWPGNGEMDAVFYSYAYPTPEGLGEATVMPSEAFWSGEMGEFFLPYEAVRAADDPDAKLLEFLQSTYEAAANLANWDREALERH